MVKGARLESYRSLVRFQVEAYICILNFPLASRSSQLCEALPMRSSMTFIRSNRCIEIDNNQIGEPLQLNSRALYLTQLLHLYNVDTVTLHFVIITQFVIHYNYKLRWIATQFVINHFSKWDVRATRFAIYYKLRLNFIISLGSKNLERKKNWWMAKCIVSIIVPSFLESEGN